MPDQQEVAKAPELILLETLIKSVQEIDQSQPGQQSSSFSPDSVIQLPPSRLRPEDVGHWQAIRYFWSVIPLVHNRFALSIAAVILGALTLGALVGFLTPWLTSIF